MAGPTDLLNNDVQELKTDLRDLRSNMEVLKADIHRIDVSLAELRSDVKNAIGVAKWAALTFVGFVLTFGVASTIGAVYWGATLAGDVKAMEKRLDKFEASITKALDQAKARPGPGVKAN